jgi:hypothetical protein
MIEEALAGMAEGGGGAALPYGTEDWRLVTLILSFVFGAGVVEEEAPVCDMT